MSQTAQIIQSAVNLKMQEFAYIAESRERRTRVHIVSSARARYSLLLRFLYRLGSTKVFFNNAITFIVAKKFHHADTAQLGAHAILTFIK